MGPLVLLVVGILTSQALAANTDVSKQYEPMVAFMCDKPTMYMTAEGWQQDQDQDCMQEPTDVLTYCKKTYPKHDVTNVVPLNDKVKISNWCKFDVKHCHHHGTHVVRPWRCLVEHKKPVEKKKEPTDTNSVHHHTAEVEKSDEKDDYYKYMHNVDMPQHFDEHDKFKAAEKVWQKHHHEKITKMMKDWAEAREQVQTMKSSDPKGGDRLNKEITERFQKTYSAMEQEGVSEKKQLVALHQRHVQQLINEKRRTAIDDYTDSLMMLEPEAGIILHSLKRLIKIEEKDRMHTVNHFKHVQDTDPVEADRIRRHTIEHLKTIDQRVNQTIAMLKRVPQFEQKIKTQILEYLDSFQGIDKSIAQVLVKPTFTEEENEKLVEKYKEEIQKERNEVQPPPQPEEEKKRPLVKPKKPFHPIKIDDGGLEPPLMKVKPVKVKPVRIVDDETDEDEHRYVELKQVKHVDHHRSDTINMEEQKSIEIKPIQGVAQQASTLGIAIGCVTVFVVIVVAVILLRKKARRVPVHHDFIDEATSPEERHVANMQINGYENPTYSYFETTT